MQYNAYQTYSAAYSNQGGGAGFQATPTPSTSMYQAGNYSNQPTVSTSTSEYGQVPPTGSTPQTVGYGQQSGGDNSAVAPPNMAPPPVPPGGYGQLPVPPSRNDGMGSSYPPPPQVINTLYINSSF